MPTTPAVELHPSGYPIMEVRGVRYIQTVEIQAEWEWGVVTYTKASTVKPCPWCGHGGDPDPLRARSVADMIQFGWLVAEFDA